MERATNTTAWNKACLSGRQVSEIELIYKSQISPSERPQIRTSRDAYELFLLFWDENKIEFVEQFKVMFLNRANRVLGIYELSTGGISGTVADPKLIFAAALKACSSNIIVCHSHPSGNLKPSRADEELTAKIKAAGQFLELPVVDHLIISREGYLSFSDEGIL